MPTQNDIFNTTRDYVSSCFNDEAQLRHFDRTVYWMKQLNPNVDDYLLIAAIGHDIARAFVKKSASSNPKGILDEEYLKEHQEGGAKILGGFLKTQNCDQGFIYKVENAVSKHEVGGDDGQNILKDADSISFLENGFDIYQSFLDRLGLNETRKKFNWMYDRITSSTAKQIAKPYHELLIARLNNEAQ